MVYCKTLFPEASSVLLLSPEYECAMVASRTRDAPWVWQVPFTLTEASGYTNPLEILHLPFGNIESLRI